MDLRTLQYFLTIAREENITKAAALLHVTQPTLSRQMMQLEKELGVKLFSRSNHSITLTPQGHLLKRRAQEMVTLAEKTKKELIQEEHLSGEIAIGSGEYRNSRLLAQIVASFQQKHPDVTVEIYSGNSDNIKDRIERGTLDIGFLLEPVDVDKYEYLRSPIKEEWGVWISEDSDLACRPFVTPEDLAHRPLIFTRRNAVQGKMYDWFGEYKNQLKVVASGNLPFNLACLARQSQAAYLNLKKDCKYDGMVYIPLKPKLETNTLLAWKKNQIMTLLMRTFVEHIKSYIIGISDYEK